MLKMNEKIGFSMFFVNYHIPSILEFLSERGNSVGVTSIVPVNDVIVDIIRASK